MRRWYPLFGILVFLAMVQGSAEPKTISAVYARNALSLSIPYEAARNGEAELRVEVLNPEDHVIGEAEHKTNVAEGAGVWNAKVELNESMMLDELVWNRVRFTLRYENQAQPDVEDIRSISEILVRPELHILAQRSYIAGAQAAMRVIVQSASHEGVVSPINRGTIRIELAKSNQGSDQKSVLLFTGPLDRRGSAEADFRFPAGLTGSFPLRFTAETPLGQVESTNTVQLEDEVSVLLTSEKPVYQPSQTIHLRALALNRADHHAVTQRALTFEVQDSRGNKVFRKATQTDSFGLASTEFALADEVNLGAYHVHVKMGDANNNAADLTVNVERYVLPKFRVMVDFDEKDGKQKRDYRPGDHVTGTVKANYFFGKPVANATVAIKASAMDVELFDAAIAEGRTNGDGVYHFDFVLPRFFAGDGSRHGAAPVVVEATVKDAAEHAETRDEPITVSETPLVITAIPESGKLLRGLENEVYILASYPDGTPAKADIEARIGRSRQSAKTDDAGIATIQVRGDQANSVLRIDADDRRGNRTSQPLPLEVRAGEDQLLVRTTHSVLKPGGRIEISLLSTRQGGAAYIDLVHEGQTILTRDVDIENGKAELNLIATPAMSGTVTVTGYLISRDGRQVTDQRLLFVQPAEELHIDAAADATSYLPGGEARVRFHVTNQKGEGVSAALGLEVVDQAVFALAEKQPGFAKVFFYLEQELMKPHYEIHSLSPTEIVEPPEDESSELHDRAARVLFAAAETVVPFTLDSEAGRMLPETKMTVYQERYRDALVEYVRELVAKVTDLRPQRDIPSAFMALKDPSGHAPRDAWGTELRVQSTGWLGRSSQWYTVRSAGADRQFNTADDLTVWLEPRSAAVSTAPGWGTSMERQDTFTVRMEHDHGPDNGMCDIIGTVMDPSGAVVSGARIQILHTEDRKSREGTTDAAGQFSFAALPPGHYRVRVDSPGFQVGIRTISLAVGDRAALSAMLAVGVVTEAVEVTAAAPVVETDMAMAPASAGAVMQEMTVVGRNAMSSADLKERGKELTAGAKTTESTVSPSGHIRSYFPEALYINPEILTDANGKASIEIPLADSITTWRMAMFASTRSGALGTATSELKVFQDFFVDLDLPVTLTQGDRVSLPVAVYNYADRGGNVDLKLEPEDWFSLNSAEEQSVSVGAGQIGAAQFTIEAKKIGKFKLALTGRMRGGSKREDIVVREIEIVPNGEAKEIVFNGRLDKEVSQTVRFPQSAIPDAGKLFVRLYPGPLSQVIEGMDSILRMPFGCFEQTSSSTYPNVLALDYMKRTKKLTPEVHAKAEGFIATGYQRLLTFEVPGGGFSWFGNAPANKILTAYGLMEFHDMARVYDVDPQVIARTRDWLIRQQQPDGSWKPDTQFINEGATNRFNTDAARITAYIAWALESADYKGPAIDKARQFIEQHLDDKMDAYTLAVAANFAVEDSKDSDFAHRAFEMLRDAATEKGDFLSWNAPETGVYATGDSAAVETTGLAVQAFLKAGGNSDLVRKALAWITSKKNGDGNWGTTQGTIMALRALVAASEQSGSDAHGVVNVMLNGTKVESLEINKDNNDLLHQFVLPSAGTDRDNVIALRFSGDGGMAYQIAGRYFVPWQQQTTDPLAIAVKYDRTRLAQDQIVTSTATIRNNMQQTANMVMVDLGIPPGFDLLSEDLQDMVQKTANARTGRLEKFSMTATQTILYFDSIAPHDSFEIHFRLQAKYPIRARGFTSRVYEYYDPSVTASANPVQFVVSGR